MSLNINMPGNGQIFIAIAVISFVNFLVLFFTLESTNSTATTTGTNTNKSTVNVYNHPGMNMNMNMNNMNMWHKSQSQNLHVPLPLPMHMHMDTKNVNNSPSQLQLQLRSQSESQAHNNLLSLRAPVHFDPKEYEKQRQQALKPFTNVTTVAYPHGPFGGFRNQYMTFTGIMLMMKSNSANLDHSHTHSQLIVESIKWKDLYGTNERLRHDVFFDVVHWNSYYPTLPRFVEYNGHEHMFPDVKFIGKMKMKMKMKMDGSVPVSVLVPVPVAPSIRWNTNGVDPFLANVTKPYAIGERGLQAQNKYKEYVKKVVEGGGGGLKGNRDVIDLTMLKGAFRPHPALQQIIDGFLGSKGGLEREGRGKGNGEDGGQGEDEGQGPSVKYMALHARIEPDMQKVRMYVCIHNTSS